MVSFTAKEQDEIINQFLDVIKVNDYIKESREKRKRCKCKDCRKHERYCVLNEMPLPEHIINNIYGFVYTCYDCEKRVEAEKELEDTLETNSLCLFNVDKLIFSVSDNFPVYTLAKKVIYNITESRYKKFLGLFKERMACNDNKEIREFIEYTLKLDLNKTVRDFNRIIRRMCEKPDFDILN